MVLFESGRWSSFRSAAPVRRRDPEDEAVGIEAGRGGQRQDVAVGHVDHRGGRAVVAHPLHRVVLEADIEGELQVLAGGALDPAELAHHPAGGAHFDLQRSGLAPELRLEPGLDPGLADLEARDLQQRIGVLELREIALGHRADIAHHVRRARPVRIVAAESHLRNHARQHRRIRRDPHHVVPGQVLGDHHRHEGAARRHLLQRPLAGRGVERHDRRQPRQHHLRIARLLPHHDDAVVLPVAGQAAAPRGRRSCHAPAGSAAG